MNIVTNLIEPRPIFTTKNIIKLSTAARERVLLDHTPVRSHEITFTHTVRTTPIKQCTQANKSSEMPYRAMEMPIFIHHTILSVDYIIYSLRAWSQTQPPGIFQRDICQVFTQHYFSSFSHTFLHGEHDAYQISP